VTGELNAIKKYALFGDPLRDFLLTDLCCTGMGSDPGNIFFRRTVPIVRNRRLPPVEQENNFVQDPARPAKRRKRRSCKLAHVFAITL